jgi:hypothetical protein
MGMLVNPSRFGSAGNGFLDGLAASPRMCLSLRKLVSTATVAVRVRRSSDNAEQDIGFSGSTVGSGLDTSALSSFVGSSSAFVTTFYDQSGNTQHAVQATTTKQPRIVNAGTYDGAVIFDGTDDFLKVTLLSNTAAQCAIYAKLAQATSGTDRVMLETSTNYNNNVGAIIFYVSGGAFVLGGCQSTGATRANSFPLASATMEQVSMLLDRSLSGVPESQAWKAGTAQSATAISTSEMTGNFATFDAYIGSRAGTSVFANSQIESLVFYAADTSGIRTSIEGIVA